MHSHTLSQHSLSSAGKEADAQSCKIQQKQHRMMQEIKGKPVISAASLKALTSPAASWPVMASTTRSVSDGCTVA